MAGAISGTGITYHAGYLTSSRVLTNFISAFVFTFVFNVVMSATIFSSNNIQLFFLIHPLIGN